MGYHWDYMNQGSEASWADRLAAHPLLISILLFAVALGLRLLALNRYVTPDELIWVYRTILFREAVRAGDWANTLVAGHPGVTTTWLGSAALSLQLAFQPAAQEAYNWITHLAYLTPDNMAAYRHLAVFLDSGRTAVALVNSLGIVAVFWLVRELLNDRVALVAALILALDPFIAGLSSLFHVDALLMTWSILSLLTLALGIGLGQKEQNGRRRTLRLFLSGSAAALAVLSKSPGLVLLPTAALGILSLLWRERDVSFGRRFARVIGWGLIWLAGFLLLLFLLFPALWAAPGQVLSTTGGNAGRHIEEALRPTFFLGEVAFDHGLIFYPTALLWRLSPLIIGGLVLLLVYLIRKPCMRGNELYLILLLIFWVLLFGAAITFAAKKFDRYLLPIIPALAILAAVALAGRREEGSRFIKGLIGILIVAQVLMLAASFPYLLSAYNPLIGGPYTAQYVMPLGWGESVSAAGAWLAEQPDAQEETAVSGIAPSLAPYFSGTTLFAETSTWQEADHVILTANTKQVEPEVVAQADRDLQLSHTIHFGLLPQAWIYDNPNAQPFEIDALPLPDPIIFGGQMALLGQDIRLNQNQEDLLFTARWQKQETDPLLSLKIQLLDEAGNIWQKLETDLLNDVYFYPQNWNDTETPQVTYRLALPSAMPPGSYSVALSLVDQKTGGQLPVSMAGQSGGVIFDAGAVQLDLPLRSYEPGAIEMEPLAGVSWLNGDLRLLGVAGLTPAVQTGGDVSLELIWQTDGALPDGLQLALGLEGSYPVILPFSSFDTAVWTPGAVLRQKYKYPVPADLPSGSYGLTAALLDSSGQMLDGSPARIGEVRVDAVDRSFTLPDDIAVPLEIRYEPGIVLRGLSPAEITAEPGESITLSLYWQSELQTAEPVTAFVHLVDEAGEIKAQSDQWPGGLPSNLWSAGQVIVDEHTLALPSDLESGNYQLMVGLYTAGDGLRLPAFDRSGASIPGDQVQLPLVVVVSE
ncbi:MAG: glycosyltransferase family 39 protein [Candidatus Promineifilaceae bacterium]